MFYSVPLSSIFFLNEWLFVVVVCQQYLIWITAFCSCMYITFIHDIKICIFPPSLVFKSLCLFHNWPKSLIANELQYTGLIWHAVNLNYTKQLFTLTTSGINPTDSLIYFARSLDVHLGGFSCHSSRLEKQICGSYDTEKFHREVATFPFRFIGLVTLCNTQISMCQGFKETTFFQRNIPHKTWQCVLWIT